MAARKVEENAGGGGNRKRIKKAKEMKDWGVGK